MVWLKANKRNQGMLIINLGVGMPNIYLLLVQFMEQDYLCELRITWVTNSAICATKFGLHLFTDKFPAKLISAVGPLFPDIRVEGITTGIDLQYANLPLTLRGNFNYKVPLYQNVYLCTKEREVLVQSGKVIFVTNDNTLKFK